MLDDLSTFADAVFQMMTDVFNLYTGSILLSGVLALWLFRKVVKIFRSL